MCRVSGDTVGEAGYRIHDLAGDYSFSRHIAAPSKQLPRELTNSSYSQSAVPVILFCFHHWLSDPEDVMRTERCSGTCFMSPQINARDLARETAEHIYSQNNP